MLYSTAALVRMIKCGVLSSQGSEQVSNSDRDKKRKIWHFSALEFGKSIDFSVNTLETYLKAMYNEVLRIPLF
jgi:hypothetical protein